METIKLSPLVLDWAASQIGSSLQEFAPHISKRSAEDIISGDLTTHQAIKYAKTTGVPLGYLFLNKPPAARELPIADFRTLPDAHPLGRDFFEVFDDTEYKQAWYREYLLSAGAEQLTFVGKFKGDNPSASIVARDIRTVLTIPDDATATLKNVEEHFAMLVSKCEDVGILVFKNGVVGNNTKRRLYVREFRGFALSDPFSPVIFVNGADVPAACVFTLAHELAHIWMGDSGVSDTSLQSDNANERFCNKVAAELLLPEKFFRQLWMDLKELSTSTSKEIIDYARNHFNVSRLVIARRALDLGFIQRNLYDNIYEEAKKHRKSSGSGGNFYRTLATRNSKKFSKRVASLAVSGSISLREAGHLLNTNPNNVVKFHAKQN